MVMKHGIMTTVKCHKMSSMSATQTKIMAQSADILKQELGSKLPKLNTNLLGKY